MNLKPGQVEVKEACLTIYLLMEKGLLMEIGDRPGSTVLRYERRKK